MRSALAIAALALLVYLPVLLNDFVVYDDDLLITAALPIREGLSAESVAWAFRSTEAANWIPLTRLSWLLEVEFFGLDPRVFHATNAMLHALTSALLFLALSRLTGAPARSALVAAIFAVHPLNVEAVAWAAARRDVLAGAFAALSLLTYERAARLGGVRRHARVALALAAGLLSKPMLVSWPLVLLLLDGWPLRRLGEPGLDVLRLRSALVEKLPLFVLAAAASAITLAAQSDAGALRSLEGLSLGARMTNALAAYAHYTADAFWPSGLAVFYPHPGAAGDRGFALAGAGLLLAGTATAVWQRRRRPWLAVGWLWYVGMLVPVIGLVQAGQAARADRYVYLPMIGFWIAAVWTLFDALGERQRLKRVVAALCVVAVGALAVTSWMQLGHWRDSERLFLHALRVTERNHVAHINLGMYLTRQGRLREASAHLLAGLRITPRFAVGIGLLGDLRVAQDRDLEAIRLYRQALQIEPGSERWRRSLAAALEARGAPGEVRALQDGLPKGTSPRAPQ